MHRWVWVDTKGHPGELRGKLFAGMAHMQMTEPVEPAPRKVGRGLFLATVAGGLSSLVWGKSVWGHVSAAASPLNRWCR